MSVSGKLPTLPAGWVTYHSKKYKRPYFFHLESGRSVWVHPLLLDEYKNKKSTKTSEEPTATQITSSKADQTRGSLESFSSSSTEPCTNTLSEKDLTRLEPKGDSETEIQNRVANWATSVTQPKGDIIDRIKKNEKQKTKINQIPKTIQKNLGKRKKDELQIMKKKKRGKIISDNVSEISIGTDISSRSTFSAIDAAINSTKIRYEPYKKQTTTIIPQKNTDKPVKPIEKATSVKGSKQANVKTVIAGKIAKNNKKADVKKAGTEILKALKKDSKVLPKIPKLVRKYSTGSSGKSSDSNLSKRRLSNPFLEKSSPNFKSPSQNNVKVHKENKLPQDSFQRLSQSSPAPFQQNPFFKTPPTSRRSSISSDNVFPPINSDQQEAMKIDSGETSNLFKNQTETLQQNFVPVEPQLNNVFYQQLQEQHQIQQQQQIQHQQQQLILNEQLLQQNVQFDIIANEEEMEIDNAVEMSREIMREIREIREENIVAKPQVVTESEAAEFPEYTDPLYIVVDTNILLGHLKFVAELKDYPIPGVGAPILLIPWMVLQELDSLKDAVNRRHTQVNDDGVEEKSEKLNILARQAIKFISNCLKVDHPRVKGESVIEAGTPITGFTEESNDDSIIHCCLGLKSRAAHSHIVMLSNDRNLCNKAIITGVKAFGQKSILMDLRSLFQSGAVAMRRNNHQDYDQESKIQEILAKRRKQADDLACELQCILREGIAVIIETEMKEAYGDELWLSIVKIQPPWTLSDVFTLLAKHWVAVFGLVIERKFSKTVDELKKKLQSGEGAPGNLETVKEMLELSLQLFGGFIHRSNYDDMLPRCLAGAKVLHKKCLEYIQLAVPFNTLPTTAPTQALPSNQPLPNTTQVGNDEDRNAQENKELTVFEKVMETFTVIWKTVTHFSALIFYSLKFPSALIKDLDPAEPKPTPQESLKCLSTMTPCLLKLIKMLQGVINVPVERLVHNEGVIINLLSAIYQFMKEVMQHDCSIKPQELLEFCQDSNTRAALVHGLSQLDRSYATLQQCVEYHQTGS